MKFQWFEREGKRERKKCHLFPRPAYAQHYLQGIPNSLSTIILLPPTLLSLPLPLNALLPTQPTASDFRYWSAVCPYFQNSSRRPGKHSYWSTVTLGHVPSPPPFLHSGKGFTGQKFNVKIDLSMHSTVLPILRGHQQCVKKVTTTILKTHLPLLCITSKENKHSSLGHQEVQNETYPGKKGLAGNPVAWEGYLWSRLQGWGEDLAGAPGEWNAKAWHLVGVTALVGVIPKA